MQRSRPCYPKVHFLSHALKFFPASALFQFFLIIGLGLALRVRKIPFESLKLD